MFGLHTAMLLAQGPPQQRAFIRSIRETFNKGPDNAELVIFVIGVLVFIALLSLAAKYLSAESQRPRRKPDYLTLAVDLMGLSEAVRRDLCHIARSARLAQPLSMLLSPNNLAAAAQAAAPHEDPKLYQRMDRLCLQLFEVPLPTDPQPIDDD